MVSRHWKSRQWVSRSCLLGAALLVVLISLFGSPAHAGRSCDAKPLSRQAIERGLELAATTATRLDATGAKVVVLARAGQDLGKYGLKYSHLGLAVRDEGRWLVVHKLNACGTAKADLSRQGLGQFFLDDLFRHGAAWLVPTPEVQERLLLLLADRNRLVSLHQPAYNMVAYPWATRYQQSNQWAIETLALAMEPSIRTREQAQAWLRFKAYEPTSLRLGPLTRLGGRITSANIAFDDHPNEKRFSDHIETVTVDSVFAWLSRSGLATGTVEVIDLPSPGRGT